MKFIETVVKQRTCATFVLRCTPLFALYAPVCIPLFWVVRPCFRCTPPYALPAPVCVELPVRPL